MPEFVCDDFVRPLDAWSGRIFTVTMVRKVLFNIENFKISNDVNL